MIRIDTLQISEDLKKAGLDGKLAKEFANKFNLNISWYFSINYHEALFS